MAPGPSFGVLGCSVECTTCSSEHVHTTLCSSVFWAIDGLCMLFTARLSIPKVLVVVWVPDITLVIVSEVVVAGVVAIVGSDIAVAMGCSRCEVGVHGGSRGAVAWFGRECHHTRGAGGHSEAG
jgi:hypothetical protein